MSVFPQQLSDFGQGEGKGEGGRITARAQCRNGSALYQQRLGLVRDYSGYN